MALTRDRVVPRYSDLGLRGLEMKSGSTIYRGALVSVDSNGFAQALLAGEHFGGIALAAGSGSIVNVDTHGIFEHALSGADQGDIGRPVFASSDDTLTFIGPGNTYVGVVADLVDDGLIALRLDTARKRVKRARVDLPNLATGGDVVETALTKIVEQVWITGARILNGASAAIGIDDDNTLALVIRINEGGSPFITETFDSSNAFPGANEAHELTVGDPKANVAAGTILTYQVTTGAAVNPGSFAIEVDYV